MQGGDLGNSPTPRMVFLFEGLLGLPRRDKAILVYEKTKQWDRLARCYDINEAMVVRCRDMVWRYSYTLDLVTFKPEPFAQALEPLFEEQGLPFASFYATTPNDLAHRLAYTPEVLRVYHADPSLALRFGPRGFFVPHNGEGVSLV